MTSHILNVNIGSAIAHFKGLGLQSTLPQTRLTKDDLVEMAVSH